MSPIQMDYSVIKCSLFLPASIPFLYVNVFASATINFLSRNIDTFHFVKYIILNLHIETNIIYHVYKLLNYDQYFSIK
jgi:hypothetical protein